MEPQKDLRPLRRANICDSGRRPIYSHSYVVRMILPVEP
jgi:hypothetical protein